MFKHLKNLFKGPYVADLPLENLQCELGCRVLECNEDHWRTCANRIRLMNEEMAFSHMNSRQDPVAIPGRSEKTR
jgi:hypothetical protein